MNSMYNALSGMLASAQKLQTSANNLVGLGRNKVAVGDNLERQLDVDSTQAPKADISKEMVNQITAQAEFKANAKVILTGDETIGTILNIKS
mgnify:CR=1 FL=1